ncbi:unnamed protein product [Trichogramma brassicae]|uniref:DJ-1/PfpI domain-containing protein n=1 Tax=Trichogramma brassicae TaxID=86971 RepID=A0A6H5IUS9_9HYME|nr:unnamed protein product [Trichogramma brassicae]
MSCFLSLKLLATVGSKSRAVTKFRAAAATGAGSNLVRHFSLGQALGVNLVKPKSVNYRIHKPPEWDPNDPKHNTPGIRPSIAVSRDRRVQINGRNENNSGRNEGSSSSSWVWPVRTRERPAAPESIAIVTFLDIQKMKKKKRKKKIRAFLYHYDPSWRTQVIAGCGGHKDGSDVYEATCTAVHPQQARLPADLLRARGHNWFNEDLIMDSRRLGAGVFFKNVGDYEYCEYHRVYSTPGHLCSMMERPRRATYYDVCRGVGNLVDALVYEIRPKPWRNPVPIKYRPQYWRRYLGEPEEPYQSPPRALVLSGCGGQKDGTDMYEATCTAVHVSKHRYRPSFFAPEGALRDPYDYREDTYDLDANKRQDGCHREMLNESGRLSWDEVRPLTELDHRDHMALIVPGGHGVETNLYTYFAPHI